ncbi:type IV secretion system DNA-binding domain-containing protein [Herbaspirillum sp.]|uniref:type IV secretion system DNA-binding domain-containing protein n=1 Tax=Herbaspirillum sp. TaxID=1890675 RepID=UPI000C0A215D|nr:type IV secretion system DNA-binding domain-containing protein [Herbaspirillum sp.]MAF04713.1 type IV secretion system protein VirD4 [Herbaspirillum sp.]
MARNIATTDAGVGQASFTTRVKLTIQAVRRAVQFGVIPCLIVPVFLWASWTSPRNFDIAKNFVLANFLDESTHRRWLLRNDRGQTSVISVMNADGKIVQALSPSELRTLLQNERAPYDRLIACLWISLAAGLVGYFMIWRYFAKIGKKQQENKRIAGALEKVDAVTLDKLVKSSGPTSYKVVDVSLPNDAPMRGILFSGAQGSGKSLGIHDLMQQVFRKKRKSIIHDSTGEFYRAYFRPGKDVFFNPALEGSIPFSLFEEMRWTYDANSMAEAFLPKRASGAARGANAFFEDAARAVFTVIIRRLAEFGAQDTRDIARAFLEMPAEEMAILVRNSVASSTIGGDSKQQRQGVLSSVAMYLDGIAAVSPGNWSISKWLEQDDDSRLFIVGTDDTQAMMGAVYRLLLLCAFNAISARGEVVYEDRYWFFLDEARKLGDIQIDRVLAEKRKYGVCVVAGVQSDAQFSEEVGKERAETIMNCFNTIIQYAVNDPDSQERAAKRIGRMEMETTSQNQALAVVEQRDGAGLVINEHEKWSVMPSAFGILNPCEAYLKIPGNFPVAFVNYSSWLPGGKQQKRLRSFAPIQEAPEKDARFAILRRVLKDGESAFDDVITEAEQVRKTEAEKEQAAKQQMQDQHAARPRAQDMTAAITMAFNPATGSTEGNGQPEKGADNDFNIGL